MNTRKPYNCRIPLTNGVVVEVFDIQQFLWPEDITEEDWSFTTALMHCVPQDWRFLLRILDRVFYAEGQGFPQVDVGAIRQTAEGMDDSLPVSAEVRAHAAALDVWLNLDPTREDLMQVKGLLQALAMGLVKEKT